MSDLIGKIVCGYRIVSVIGEGGMGKVYLAESAYLTEYKQQVAIKTLTAYASSERQAALLRDLFTREANIQVQFKHPHIVSVIQFAVEQGEHFLILEYMPGYRYNGRRITNIADMIACETGPIPHKRALKLFVHALDAMEYAHNFKYRWEGEQRVGIVHRDIKPANLLLLDPDTVKVSDFGIVKVQQRSPRATQKLTPGTSAYMSPEAILGPEQFDLAELDGRSDIYSLGVTLFEMLAGRLPFAPDANTHADVSLRRKHVSETPPPPSAFYPAIPQQLDEVVLRALAKRPEDRYQSAAEFKQAILALWRPSGVTARTDEAARGYDTNFFASATELLETPPTANGVAVSTASGTSSPGSTPQPSHVTPGAVSVPPTPVRRSSKLPWLIGVAVLMLAAIATFVLLRQLRSQEEARANTVAETKNSEPPPLPEGLVMIEGGSFMMGRNLTEAEKNFAVGAPGQRPFKIFSYDYPAHEINVPTFYLDKTEVSNAQYAEYVKATNQPPPDGWSSASPPPHAEQIPVTGVTLREAADYCAWRTRQRNDGFLYRLPREEEWEYAARGKNAGQPNAPMNIYPWGEQWNETLANTKESRLNHPRNVDAYPQGKSPFGILNLAGNVYEWTASDFNHYPGSDQKTPREDGYAGTYQVVRGGYFGEAKEFAMTTTRMWARPENKGPKLGFRCAAELRR
jgi:eukaryotic-like serine/threonine-protein kinase